MSDTRVTVRLWGGKMIHATVLKSFWFMRLVTWDVRESRDGSPPWEEYRESKWYPKWRIVPKRTGA